MSQIMRPAEQSNYHGLIGPKKKNHRIWYAIDYLHTNKSLGDNFSADFVLSLDVVCSPRNNGDPVLSQIYQPFQVVEGVQSLRPATIRCRTRNVGQQIHLSLWPWGDDNAFRHDAVKTYRVCALQELLLCKQRRTQV